MNTIDWKNATPEQINLWKRCSALIGWNTIIPIFYQGVIAASEFTVYNAAKLYIALEITALDVSTPILGYIELYNIANAINGHIGNSSIYWDVTAAAAKYANSSVTEKNIYFSRIVAAAYTNMKFNGYRLTTV